jgi:hypothetical protein
MFSLLGGKKFGDINKTGRHPCAFRKHIAVLTKLAANPLPPPPMHSVGPITMVYIKISEWLTIFILRGPFKSEREERNFYLLGPCVFE